MEKGLPTEAGGWCYNQGTASGEVATNGGLDDMGAGCKFTHVTAGSDGTSISTTNDNNPTWKSGYSWPNGGDREANSRDWQKPIEVQPPQSQTNEKLQRGWMEPFEHHGPQWHPYGCKAGSV